MMNLLENYVFILLNDAIWNLILYIFCLNINATDIKLPNCDIL